MQIASRRSSSRSLGYRPMMHGFDAAAPRYDDDEAGNLVLAAMRERSFARLGASFSRGSMLLELGSGTGTEASRLAAEQDCRVALVDPSRALLEVARAKVQRVREEALLGAHGIPASEVGSLARLYGEGTFDGAYSSFGALNCEPSLFPIARGLARLVRPRGKVVLSIINRWCPVEVAWFAIHGEFNEASRRWGGPVAAAAYPEGPKDVTTYYYSRREIERSFDDDFEVETAEALPWLLPPPYLDFVVQRASWLVPRAARLDAWGAGRPIVRDLGDHVLLVLRRR